MTFEGFRTACRRCRSAFGSLRAVCRGFGTTSRSFRSRRRRPARASEGFGTAFEGVGTAFEAVGTAFEAVGTAFEGFGTAFEGFGTASEGFRNAAVGQVLSAWTVATTFFDVARARAALPSSLFGIARVDRKHADATTKATTLVDYLDGPYGAASQGVAAQARSKPGAADNPSSSWVWRHPWPQRVQTNTTHCMQTPPEKHRKHLRARDRNRPRPSRSWLRWLVNQP